MSIQYIKSTGFVVLMLLTILAKGQQVLSLEEALRMALQNNYDILLSKNDSAVAALDYSYRNAVFLPQVNATAGTNWTNNYSEQGFENTNNNRSGRVGAHNINASVALNWTLFDGMRMFVARDKAGQFVQLGEKVIRNQVVNTVSQVINTYYAIVREKQQLQAVEEQIRLSQSRVELTSRRLEIGMGTRPDMLQSQVDLNAHIAARLRQEALIDQLKETLNQLLFPDQIGVASTNYDVETDIPLQGNLDKEDILRDMDSTNPLLDIARKQIDIAQLDLREVKSERWPTVQFNAGYNFSRSQNTTVINPFMPLSNLGSGFNYGLTASVPILNFRNTHRRIKQAELSINLQTMIYNSQRSQLRLGVLQAFKEYEFQKKALELEESNISLARENVDIIQESFRLGGATFVQLREAEKSLEDAYNRLISARYNTKVAETELMRLRGDLLR
jgi:outer membrane protein